MTLDRQRPATPVDLRPFALAEVEALRAKHQAVILTVGQLGDEYDVLVCSCDLGAACKMPRLLATVDAMTTTGQKAAPADFGEQVTANDTGRRIAEGRG